MAKCYGATSLIGGGVGALDRAELDGNILNDSDMAVVSRNNGQGILYRLNATSGVVENSPHIIAPDVNPGTKRWEALGIIDITLGADADGDIYIRNGDHLTRLPIGANGQILELSAGLPSWQEGAMKKSVYDTDDNNRVDTAEAIIFAAAKQFDLGGDVDSDMYYRNGGAITRLPIGTNGQLLGIAAGIPAWEDAPSGGGSTPNPWAGSVVAFMGDAVITGFLECDASLVNMSTYEDLYNAIRNNYGLDAGFVFSANPATNVIAAATHGLTNNDVVEFTTSAGDLPDGFAIDTKYFVISATPDTYKVSLTQAGAEVDILDAGSGTHRYHKQMRLPDLRGEFLRGYDHGAGNDPEAASRTARGDGVAGDNVGTEQEDCLKEHKHSVTIDTGGDAGPLPCLLYGIRDTVEVDNVCIHLEGNAYETRPHNISVMWCIKY